MTRAPSSVSLVLHAGRMEPVLGCLYREVAFVEVLEESVMLDLFVREGRIG